MMGVTESRGRDFSAFLERFPSYSDTAVLDDLRASEYARLDKGGHVYLDYTGGGLYAYSQIRNHAALLRDDVYGNPHSTNPSSLLMTRLIEETREAILAFFNASRGEYDVIFTPNATGALKLVGESYPFDNQSRLVISSDNHNSVNGIREYAYSAGSQVEYLQLDEETLRFDVETVANILSNMDAGAKTSDVNAADTASANGTNVNKLLAFPAQSNFSGVKHPLAIVEGAHELGWDVLLDAAAFVPTNPLDLSMVHPDFVPISFYKMFGYPTGVGCLLARKETLHKLRRRWYAGGTTAFSSVKAYNGFFSGHYFLPSPSCFEDGTLNYLNIPAVKIGLELLTRCGLSVIGERVMCLTEWLIDELLTLRHSNGMPLVRLYGPRGREGRGSTVLFNVLNENGDIISADAVMEQANLHNISLRTGCHCNPGAREAALHLGKDELSRFLHDKDALTLEEFLQRIEGETTGGIRVSFGIVSNFNDAATLVDMLRAFAM